MFKLRAAQIMLPSGLLMVLLEFKLSVTGFCYSKACFIYFKCFTFSKMINLSVPDTIDERTINKKKLTPFTIQVCPPSITLREDCVGNEWAPQLRVSPLQVLRCYS